MHVYDEDCALDLELLELTLVPVGPLIDGSAGATISGFLDRGVELADVPVGNHWTTARYFPADRPAVDLLIRLRGTGDYARSVMPRLLRLTSLSSVMPASTLKSSMLFLERLMKYSSVRLAIGPRSAVVRRFQSPSRVDYRRGECTANGTLDGAWTGRG